MKSEDAKIIESLKNAVAESLEGLAFIEFDKCEQISDLPELREKIFLTNIDITAPFKVSIFLICAEQFILNIIESITGEEMLESDNPIVEDTLKELLNTLTDRFMINMLSEDAEFDFGIPNFLTLDNKTEIYKKNKYDLVLKFNYDEDVVYCIFKDLSDKS